MRWCRPTSSSCTTVKGVAVDEPVTHDTPDQPAPLAEPRYLMANTAMYLLAATGAFVLIAVWVKIVWWHFTPHEEREWFWLGAPQWLAAMDEHIHLLPWPALGCLAGAWFIQRKLAARLSVG